MSPITLTAQLTHLPATACVSYAIRLVLHVQATQITVVFRVDRVEP